MTIDLDQVTHLTTVQALAYAQDYYLNYYDPLNPLTSYHRYDHSDHIEALATWGYHGDFFVQSRIKLTVLYGLPSDWTDEVAMRGWIFWRNPITRVWTTTLESEATSVHHWQEAHQHIKQEATQMALKRAKITAYYPLTHQADIEIYPHPGETMLAVPLAPEIGPVLAALLPDCALAIFYDTAPPSPYITSLLDGVAPAWVTSALLKIDDHVDFSQYQTQWALFHMGTAFPTDPAPVQGQPFWRTDQDLLYVYDGDDWLSVATEAPTLQVQQVTRNTGDVTLDQMVWTDLPDMVITMTPTTGRVLLIFQGTLSAPTSTHLQLDFTVDGVRQGEDMGLGFTRASYATRRFPTQIIYLLTALPEQSHVFRTQYKYGITTAPTLFASTVTSPLLMIAREM